MHCLTQLRLCALSTLLLLTLLLAGELRVAQAFVSQRAPSSTVVMRAHAQTALAGTAGAVRSKVIHLVRHGQAQHNVRAEPARSAGCSYDEFLELMRLDDAFDATLTPVGVEQVVLRVSCVFMLG